MCDIGKTTKVHQDEAPPIIVKPQPKIVEPIPMEEPVKVPAIRKNEDSL